MPKPFATEADLCSAFIAEIGDAWTAYPETAGWDILLVRKTDGFQIGIEAKLRLNTHVISQALEDWGSWSADRAGPDCRAVLVPECDSGGFGVIADYIGLVVIRYRKQEGKYPHYGSRNFQPGLPGDRYDWKEWHEWGHSKRHTLPAYVPDVIAGSSAPIQLTTWKIAAIKIAVTVERRGFVIRADFQHLGIDHRRWFTPGQQWLVNDNGKMVPGPRMPNFKEQHPRVYQEIAADAEVWMLKVLV